MDNIYLYILSMALTTYLIRMLQLALFKKEITSNFVKSFLFYVPYACLACMTFPAILSSTTYFISGLVGLIVAIAYSTLKNEANNLLLLYFLMNPLI